MYFKNHAENVQKGYMEFEKKDTLNQMAASTSMDAVQDDGNKFFNEIHQQFYANQSGDKDLYVEVEAEHQRLEQQQ